MSQPPERETGRPSTAAIVVMCGPLAGLSGGDVHALRLVQRWNQRYAGGALLLAPELMRPSLPAGVEGQLRPVRTPVDRLLRGLASYALIVLLRTLITSINAPKARVTIASSHFFHDVIPCAVHRLRHRSRPVAYVYHLVREMDRPPSLRTQLSVAAETLSVTLLRRTGALVFVDNDQTRAALESAGLDPGSIAMTRNAYDPSIPLPPRSRPETPHLLFAGRFTAEKGIWDMLALSRALAEQVPEARVTMIGDGPLRAEFTQAAQSDGLAKLAAPGFVTEEEKWSLLRSATLFVAPSVEEGWGIAVGEALTAELPTVVYDLPAYEHFGDLVRRVPTGDREAFVRTVTGLLEAPGELHELERHVAAAGSLQTWSEILDGEIERMMALSQD
jgi:glycosyltransferase involved in cell wall biosynthesis